MATPPRDLQRIGRRGYARQFVCATRNARQSWSSTRAVRHGPGHNVAISHRNFDAQNVEFYMSSIRWRTRSAAIPILAP